MLIFRVRSSIRVPNFLDGRKQTDFSA